ncbi:SSI family serine proteinase inhibitor [Streptomyces sp. NPDC004749]
MPLRLSLTAAACLVAAAAVLGAAGPVAADSPHAGSEATGSGATEGVGGRVGGGAPKDRLTVTVRGSGDRAADGTYELTCGPTGGSHPRAAAACDRLAKLAGEKRDPFAPVAKDAMCTMIDGGPATAKVTGTWRGRAVNASFDRTNGCEISRWQAVEPVLPAARG